MKAIITGACGFIGSQLAIRLLSGGVEVIGIDNLTRLGSDVNCVRLSKKGFSLLRLDLSNTEKTFEAFAAIGPVDAVFHLAAQTAVTISYRKRYVDFQDNAGASFNVIEAVLRYTPGAYCLYASTNKVYGHIGVCEPIGVERQPDPYTPYGVSKYIGELYFREYGRREIGLSTCCLRQSCIYGQHQYGLEDNGWLAWFAVANLLGKPVTIYGNGKQVRDLLFVEDLIELYLECWEHRLTGSYPVGGQQANAINLIQGLTYIRNTTGREFKSIGYKDPRSGDQPYFVADCSWTGPANLSWRPRVCVPEGVQRMVTWMRENQDQIGKVLEH